MLLLFNKESKTRDRTEFASIECNKSSKDHYNESF